MKYIVSDGMKSEMRYVELSDAQLWKLIIEKDKVAFEQLYRRYYSPLLAYALLSVMMKKWQKIAFRIYL